MSEPSAQDNPTLSVFSQFYSNMRKDLLFETIFHSPCLHDNLLEMLTGKSAPVVKSSATHVTQGSPSGYLLKPEEYRLPRRLLGQRCPQALLLWRPCLQNGTRTFSSPQESPSQSGQIQGRTEGRWFAFPYIYHWENLGLEIQVGRLMVSFELKQNKLLIPFPF